MNELVIMAPLDKIVLPATLDGSQGQHRVRDKSCLISANNDIEAIRAWLAEYEKSKKTYRNYQKEAERFLLWAVIERHKPLSSINADDLLAYSDFLDDPQPHERWCGPKLARRGQRYSQHWKPFVGKLTPPSKVTAFASLNSLFNYLYKARYLDHNPIITVPRQIKHHTTLDEYKWKLQERIIDIDEWETVLDVLNTLPNETAGEQFEKARLRFLFALLYFSGLRIDELVSNRMNAFVKRYHYEAQKD